MPNTTFTLQTIGSAFVAADSALDTSNEANERYSLALDMAASATFALTFPDGSTKTRQKGAASLLAVCDSINAAYKAAGSIKTVKSAGTISILAEVGRWNALGGTFGMLLPAECHTSTAHFVRGLINAAIYDAAVPMELVRDAIAKAGNKAEAVRALKSLGNVVETEMVTDENGNEVEVEIVPPSPFDKAVESATKAIAKALANMPDGITADQLAAVRQLVADAALLGIAVESAASVVMPEVNTAEAFAAAV